MTNPKVSVIIGIYNCADTLQEALDSLYAQTFQDFEIILCDDGSLDDTFNIALKNKSKYPDKIKLIQNSKNCGLNITLNNCLKYAKGEYIARMDGDDVSLPTRFEQEVEFLDENPKYSIVSGPMIYFDEFGDFKEGRGNGEVTINDLIKGTPFCHAPCMVRKEAYDKVNGYSVDKRLLRVEDYHLWFKMYSSGFIGYNLKYPIYKMRDNRNAMFRRTWRNRINESYVRLIGYKMIKAPWYHYIYILRPILVGLLPKTIYTKLHKRN